MYQVILHGITEARLAQDHCPNSRRPEVEPAPVDLLPVGNLTPAGYKIDSSIYKLVAALPLELRKRLKLCELLWKPKSHASRSSCLPNLVTNLCGVILQNTDRQTDRQTLPIAKPALQPMDRVIMQMLSVGEARRSRGRGFWTAFSDYTGPDLLRSTVFHF